MSAGHIAGLSNLLTTLSPVVAAYGQYFPMKTYRTSRALEHQNCRFPVRQLAAHKNSGAPLVTIK